MIATDPRTFMPAVFHNSKDFPHFQDPDHPKCFICNSRMMLVGPIAYNKEFILLEATMRLDDGRFVVIPGCWLVFPRNHVESFDDMPDNWTGTLKQARRILGLQEPLCASDNWGEAAGQTVKHGHTWLIDRSGDEAGLLSHRTGLATILQRIKQHGIEMP